MEKTAPLSVYETITERQRIRLLATTVAGHALKHVFSAAFFVLVPEIKAGLGLSNTQVGTLSTIRNVAGGVVNLPAGYIADRYAPRRAEILGMSIAMVGVFALLLGASPNYWTALMAAALFTIAITFWHPAAIASLSRIFANRRGFAIALHGTGGSIGEAVGPTLTGFLVGYLGWRLVLQGSVVPAILCGLLVWLLLRRIPTGAFSTTKLTDHLRAMARLLRNPRLLLVLLFAAGFSGGQSTILTFLPIYLREDLGASSFTLGLYLSLANVGGIVSQPLMGYVSDRLGRKAVLAPSLAILGVMALGLYLAPHGIIFALIILVMGTFLFPLLAIVLASAMDLVEGNVQATTVSLVFGSGVVVSGFTPSIAGVVADVVSVKATFIMASAILLTTSFLVFVTRWQPSTAKPGT